MSDDSLRKSQLPRYLVPSAHTHGICSIIILTVEPGGGTPPHTHLKEDERFCPLAGNFRLWIKGQEPIDIGPGEFAFAPREVEHYFRNVGDTPGELMVIFLPGGAEEYFRELDVARANSGPDLLQREEAIDAKYGMVIDRRTPPP